MSGHTRVVRPFSHILSHLFDYRNSGDGRFVLGRRYSSEDLTFDLPSGTDLCDVATFTIWCQAASAFFTRVDIPSSLFVS